MKLFTLAAAGLTLLTGLAPLFSTNQITVQTTLPTATTRTRLGTTTRLRARPLGG